jgi:hypothetical protein
MFINMFTENMPFTNPLALKLSETGRKTKNLDC